MRNPLRSEDEAFRFLIASVVAALVIAGAAYVNTCSASPPPSWPSPGSSGG